MLQHNLQLHRRIHVAAFLKVKHLVEKVCVHLRGRDDVACQSLSLLLRLLRQLPCRSQHQRHRRLAGPPGLWLIPLGPALAAALLPLLLLLIAAAAARVLLLQRQLPLYVHKGGQQEACCLAAAC